MFEFQVRFATGALVYLRSTYLSVKCSSIGIDVTAYTMNVLFAHAGVVQSRDESLGVSVAGGVKNQKGDTPIYISNITDMGCVGRTRQIQVSQPAARSGCGISQSRRRLTCVRKVIAGA